MAAASRLEVDMTPLALLGWAVREGAAVGLRYRNLRSRRWEDCHGSGH